MRFDKQLEIARLKREVIKLKAERDIRMSRAVARLRAVKTARAILAAWRVSPVEFEGQDGFV
jgi:hypothetical protein